MDELHMIGRITHLKTLLILLLSIIISVTTLHAQYGWSRVASTTDDLRTIFFVNSLTGWVGGKTGPGGPGVIRRTIDGGSTWTIRALPFSDFTVTKIYFLNSIIGYACGSGGTILKTTDGGDTWIQKTSGSSSILFSIFFFNPLHGWAAAENSVLITRDGGETWSSTSVPTEGVIYDISFTNEQEGMLIDASGSTFKSSDGGKSWLRLVPPSGLYRIGGVKYLSPIRVACFSGQHFSFSTDGGLTWSVSYETGGENIVGMCFADSLTGYLAGSGKIIKTIDGGSHWSEESMPPTYVTAIHCPDGIHAWALGYQEILKKNELPVGAPSPSHTTITAIPISIKADGKSTSAITVQIRDSLGNPYPSSAGIIVLKATLGSISSVTDIKNGKYTAVFTAPSTAGMAMVTGTLNGTPFSTTVIIQLRDTNAATFPLSIGNKWFYSDDKDRRNTIVREVTDTTAIGDRIVWATYKYADSTRNKKTLEYWQFKDGNLYNDYYEHTSSGSVPVFISSLTKDSSTSALQTDYYWNLTTANYFSNYYSCQTWIGYYHSMSVYYYDVYVYAPGIGISEYTYYTGSLYPYLAYYEYKLRGYIKDGVLIGQSESSVLSVKEPSSISMRYQLDQNYPNPFNPMTTIAFSLPSKSFVSLKVFDVMGREVSTVVSEEMAAGNYTRQWNAAGFPSGVYFYRMQAGTYAATKHLVLLK
jgi:photosystem II stability/assembly factor-like uncharacterized protein